MAQVIIGENETQSIVGKYSIYMYLLIGLVSGLAFWLISTLIGEYVINPLYCNTNLHSLTCANSVTIAGDISAIIVAIAGVVYMVNRRMTQPLLIALATTISIWGISAMTNGLPYFESIGWIILCYVLGYLLFSWITRYNRVAVVLALIAVSVVMVRVVLYL